MQRVSILVLVVYTCACTRADPPGNKNPVAVASAVPVASASVASPPPVASAPAGSAAAFAGKYDSKAGTLYLPDSPEMKRVKWRGDESKDGLGPGELTLDIDADGRVHGEASGALGAMIVEGHAEGDHVGASLRRKDPTDGGFTGTLEGTRNAGTLGGELQVTGFDASVFRVAKFQLTGK